MRLKRARGYRRGRIEIIPMIDVMFFLLVTFMLASLAMQNLQSLRVDLPKGEAAPMPAGHPLTLTVTRDGTLLVNQTPATLDTLADILRPLVAGSDGTVVVNADSAAPNGVVVQAMLRGRAAGAEKFLFAVGRR